MNFFQRLWAAAFPAVPTPPAPAETLASRQTAAVSDPAAGEMFRPATAAGVAVTDASALSSTAVFCAIATLTETVAQLPLITYRRLSDSSRQRATNLRLYELLHESPNDEMDDQAFREWLTADCVAAGNGYAEIQFDGRGDAVALWPLDRDTVTPARARESDAGLRYRAGDLVFEIRQAGQPLRILADWEIFRLKGLGPQGWSPLRMFAESIGVDLAARAWGASFFANGARPSGILKHPKVLTEPAAKRLKNDWQRNHGGAQNAGIVGILEEGMEYQQLTIPPEEAQFLETRQFQIAEIARIYRVPPHLLFDLSRATFSNIEHLSLEFVKFSLGRWLTRWEKQITRKLIPARFRGEIYAEHLLDGLLRGDTASRYNAYSIGRQWGWLSANDIRRAENLDAIDNGDLYLTPGNMLPADAPVPTQTEPPPPPAPDPATPAATLSAAPESTAENAEHRGKQRTEMLSHSFRAPLVDTLLRFARKEKSALERQSSKPKEFLSWIDTFYRHHCDQLAAALVPAARAWCAYADPAAQAETLAQEIAARVCDSGRAHLLAASERVNYDQFSAAVPTWSAELYALRERHAAAVGLD